MWILQEGCLFVKILADLISSRTLPSIIFTWINYFRVDKYSAKLKCINITLTYPADSSGQPNSILITVLYTQAVLLTFLSSLSKSLN